MTRLTQTIGVLGALTAVWLSMFLGLVRLPEPIQTDIVPVMPFWALITFGCYMVGALGRDVFTFKDKEQDYRSLMKDIDEARAFLQKHNVDVD